MTKTDLINILIRQRGYRRYLELAVFDEQINYFNIRTDIKRRSFPMSPDVFFEKNEEKYDLILIDGIHTEEQVLKDYKHAFNFLSKDGAIIFHDCMPPDAWHQRSFSEYRPGENWNGQVWKAVLRIFNESPFKCTLIDADWGCGILDTSQTQNPKLHRIPSKLDYNIHYRWLLEYRTSAAGFLRDQIKLFYHLACMGNWKEVFREQMSQLRKNGFRQAEMTVLGMEDELTFIKQVGLEMGIDLNIVFQSKDLTLFEKPALCAIEKYAKHHDGNVLYLHSKGVSNPSDHTKIKWRQLMMHELVENWEYCMGQLAGYDVVGVNWRDMHPTSHFCGNFWYASTKYLRKLKDFNWYYDNPRYQIWDAIHNKRLGCEFWIGSSPEKPRVLSLYCRNVDFCNHQYWSNR